MPKDEFYNKEISLRIFNTRFWPIVLKTYLNTEDTFLLEFIKLNSSILDIGCGEGRHIKILSKKCSKLVGIDFSKAMINKAKQNLSNIKNVELFLEDADKLHFSNHEFDYVICMFNTFGNMPKNMQIDALREMKRVVKKTGKIIISVYSEKAKETQKQFYKKMGFTITKEDENFVYTKEGLISERFTIERLIRIFDSANLNMDIKKLTDISYICISK